MIAADLLAAQGVEISVIRLTQLAPLNISKLEDALKDIENVVIAEEASAGISDTLTAALNKNHRICAIGLGNEYVTHGSISQLHKQFGLDPASMAGKVTEVLKNEN